MLLLFELCFEKFTKIPRMRTKLYSRDFESVKRQSMCQVWTARRIVERPLVCLSSVNRDSYTLTIRLAHLPTTSMFSTLSISNKRTHLIRPVGVAF